MARCINCNNKVGLLSGHRTRTGRGPFCKSCFRWQTAVCDKYFEHIQKAEKEPRAAAWVALCHLVCAERTNVVIQRKHTVFGKLGEAKPTWPESRAKALEYAEKAKAMLLTGSDGEAFLTELLNRARGLQCPSAEEARIEDSTSSPGPMLGGTGYTLYEWALISGEATKADLEMTLNSIPGREWLG